MAGSSLTRQPVFMEYFIQLCKVVVWLPYTGTSIGEGSSKNILKTHPNLPYVNDELLLKIP